MLGRIVFLLLALAAWLTPPAAYAAEDASGRAPACHAYSADSLGIEAADKLDWICDSSDWKDGQQVSWLLFRDWDPENPPRALTSRITKFTTISIAAIDASGGRRSVSYRMRDASGITAGAVFVLPLPEARPDTRAYAVRIARPHSVTITSDARLVRDARTDRHSVTAIMVLALVAGLLVTPLLFDLNFYFVLRERFVLRHATIVIAMMGYVLFSGGLIFAIADVPIALAALLGPLSFPLAASAGAFFLRDFLEPGTLPSSIRKTLTIAGWWVLIVPGFCALKFDWSQSFDNQLYFIAFAPIIPFYSFAVLTALFRGSRSAMFLGAAWVPMFAAGIERQLRGIGAYAGSSSFDTWLFVAMGLEVVIMAVGVADRFLAIRHERDRAVTDARTLQELSTRDELTGLLNRRALLARFGHLRRIGYSSLGVLDLDRFKSINDQLGHGVGDDVLRAVAAALAADRDMIAFRLGGEEFIILVRGEQAAAKAERVRRAISLRVAQNVPGLHRLVTASIGLLEMDRHAMPDASFDTLYEQADRLLYEAKASGRNRTASERLKVFHRGRSTRRARAG